MISWLPLVFRALSGIARSRVSLAAENAVLRHQLSVLQRERARPLLRPALPGRVFSRNTGEEGRMPYWVPRGPLVLFRIQIAKEKAAAATR